MTVQRVIHDMLEEGKFIRSTKDVVEEVALKKGIDVKPWYVRAQLRAQGLKYKKLNSTSTNSNSERTLVLRQ